MNGKVSQNTDTSQATRENNDEFILQRTPSPSIRLPVRWSPSLPWASEREVDAAIALAAAGYRQWRQTPLADRADALRRIGAALRAPAVKGGPDDHP